MMTTADALPFLRAHECFRRDFSRLRDLLDSREPFDEARGAALVEYWRDLAAVLEHHHENEDRVIFPRLISALPSAAKAIRMLEEEHVRLDDLLARAEVTVTQAADPAQRRVLAGVFRELDAVVSAHLDSEEREIVPLFPRCFRRDEWARMEGENTRELADRGLFPFVLPWILEGMGEEMAAQALAAFGDEARQAYHATWLADYERRRAMLWPTTVGTEVDGR